MSLAAAASSPEWHADLSVAVLVLLLLPAGSQLVLEVVALAPLHGVVAPPTVGLANWKRQVKSLY